MMNADTENLVLEHLRHIRGKVDRIADDVKDLKVRMTHLEEGQAVIHRRIDRVEDRLDRIEKRLELTEA